MRLLVRAADGGITLTRDLIDSLPAYAILSHTWGADEDEVTFKDMAEGQGRSRPGYRKIEFCAQQAAADGIMHFWVDTCCIDKSNNTELSEAINSMFKWYKEAEKGYVYLPDVTLTEDDVWKDEFRASRWFTRGWTLQELIAPSLVEFFSVEGRRLGDRVTLETLLHEITGISVQAFRGRTLSEFSVEERRSWMSGRRTKRQEDMAYSLLGIFGVYMPLIYGEGEESSLLRLQDEVDKRGNFLRNVISKLPVAEGASFESFAEQHLKTCHPDTRVELLKEISDWVEEGSMKAVYWLSGMAGTGKSTISRTFAQKASRLGLHVASFFFKRGEGDRGMSSKIFTTITAQLVQKEPGLADLVHRALQTDPSITSKSLKEQFQLLILSPLSQNLDSETSSSRTLVIVIDALDECESEDDIRLLIYLFSQANTVHNFSLRVFITSRPELPIRLGFHEVQGSYHDLRLHDIPELVVERDLRAYLVQELGVIKSNYDRSVPMRRRLPEKWPELADVDALVAMANPLFIFAATACRFLSERKNGNPKSKLQYLLQHQSQSQGSRLDATYLPVLDQMTAGLEPQEAREVMEQFRLTVGTIVNLASPLPVSALSTILCIEQDEIEDHLDMFHSVLSIPTSPEVPIKLLHLSFRDFLVDPAKKDKSAYWIDESHTHRRIASQCIQLMEKKLHADMFSLRLSPGIARETISAETIAQHIQPDLYYACQYWCYHLTACQCLIESDEKVLAFLEAHLLHWVEVLSLIGRLPQAFDDIKALKSLAKNDDSKLSRFLADTTRFLQSSSATIQRFPLQVYCSAVVFAPQTSLIGIHFRSHIDDWFSLRPNVDIVWSPLLRTLEGNTRTARSVSFSLDSRFVASGSNDGSIKVWSADTGQCLHTLKGHKGHVSSIAISHDSQTIYSGSEDGSVRVWSVTLGTCERILFEGLASVTDISLSLDGLLASVSVDWTLRLWNSSGTLRQVLKTPSGPPGPYGPLLSVDFSQDKTLVVASSDKGYLFIWNVETGLLVGQMFAKASDVHAVVFSPDSTRIAATSADGVRLWTRATHDDDGWSSTKQELRATWTVWALAFSHDAQWLASAGSEGEIRVWDLKSGVNIWKCDSTCRHLRSIAFSPSSNVLATGGTDATVQLWAVDLGGARQEQAQASVSYMSMYVSPNKKIAVTTSRQGDLHLWSTKTGTRLTFEGLTYHATTVCFSPDSNYMAAVDFHGDVQIVSCVSRRVYRTLPRGYNFSQIAFSLDSLSLLTTNKECIVNSWGLDGRLDQPLRVIKDISPSVTWLGFSPDASMVLAYAEDTRAIHIWSVSTGAHHRTITVDGDLERYSVKGIMLSPGSKFIAAVLSSSVLAVWDVETKMLKRLFRYDLVRRRGQPTYQTCVTFSPDCTLIALSSEEIVRVWSLDSRRSVRSFRMGHYSHPITFSPDNATLHTGAGSLLLPGQQTDLLPLSSSPPPLELEGLAIHRPFAQSVVRTRLDGRIGYGISHDNSWITYNGHRCLWLPVEFRPEQSFISGELVILASGRGRFAIMRFHSSESVKSAPTSLPPPQSDMMRRAA